MVLINFKLPVKPTLNRVIIILIIICALKQSFLLQILPDLNNCLVIGILVTFAACIYYVDSFQTTDLKKDWIELSIVLQIGLLKSVSFTYRLHRTAIDARSSLFLRLVFLTRFETLFAPDLWRARTFISTRQLYYGEFYQHLRQVRPSFTSSNGELLFSGQKLHALSRISHFLDTEQLKRIMKAFILSQFNYCPLVWMFCDRTLNNQINRIHERALQITYKDMRSDFHAMLLRDNAVLIHIRNLQLLMTEIYKTKWELNLSFMKEISVEKHSPYGCRGVSKLLFCQYCGNSHYSGL